MMLLPELLLATVSPAGRDFLAATGEYSFSTGVEAEEEHEEGSQEEKEPPPAARQNIILRSHFRSQYMHLRAERYDLNETFMEKYVDRQIDTFLSDIDARLKQLNYWLKQAELAYAKWSDPNQAADEQQERARLNKALREVDKAAGGLKGKLDNIFLRLNGKEKPPVEIQPEDGFDQEMTFLREQVNEAEKRIRDYLFRTTNVIPYESIRGENMIIRLYWTEKTANGIRDVLRR
jgi:hypothetical protein